MSTTSSAHGGAVYETDTAVEEYLQFHFGTDADILPYPDGPVSALNFASRTAALCVEWCRKAGVPLESAFDVGCSVGRTSFDLSADFAQVVGLDFSHAFIRAANKMKVDGSAEYTCTLEGDIRGKFLAKVPAGVHPERIAFMQGDACALPDLAGLGGRKFSVVHGANLLCRLPDPRKFLERLPSVVVPGGLVVFISPFSWLPQYTPKTKWLGGTVDAAGAAHGSRDGLVAVMGSLGFSLLHEEECPFLIREHLRKYQWGCSHVTVFQLAK